MLNCICSSTSLSFLYCLYLFLLTFLYIPTVEVRSPADFKEIHRLVNEGEPVLMKNILPFLSQGKNISRTSIKRLARKYGDSKVIMGPVPYSDVFRLEHSVATLQQFYEEHVVTQSEIPLYVFQKNPNITQLGLTALSDLVKKAFPKIICPVEYLEKSCSFSLGNDQSRFLKKMNRIFPFTESDMVIQEKRAFTFILVHKIVEHHSIFMLMPSIW